MLWTLCLYESAVAAVLSCTGRAPVVEDAAWLALAAVVTLAEVVDEVVCLLEDRGAHLRLRLEAVERHLRGCDNERTRIATCGAASPCSSLQSISSVTAGMIKSLGKAQVMRIQNGVRCSCMTFDSVA
jgi:hypothetical protein